MLVDDEAIAAFYGERLPEGVHSLATFERWREDAERADPRKLFMTRDALMRHAAAHVTEELFPEATRAGRNRVAAQVPLRAGPAATTA